MKRISILSLCVALLALSSCAYSTIGDWERSWSQSMDSGNTRLSISDASRGISEAFPFGEETSLSVLAKNFGHATSDAVEATSVSGLNRAIRDNESYQKTLDNLSVSSLNRKVSEAQKKR